MCCSKLIDSRCRGSVEVRVALPREGVGQITAEIFNTLAYIFMLELEDEGALHPVGMT